MTQQYRCLAFEVEQRVLNREEFLSGRLAYAVPALGVLGEEPAGHPEEVLVVNR